MVLTSHHRAMPSRFILVAATLSLLAAVGQAADPANSRPNNLFIYADDHSPRMVSCYDHAYEIADTPNIDALAAGGLRFAAAYLGGWCMPSRAALLTGLHPHRIESMRMVGEYPGSTYDPERCRFWPATFREQGYQTAQIGKWHTGIDAGYGRDWDFQSGTDRTHARWLRQAHECLMSVDEGVGRLIDALRDTGQLANTLVVYSSDQGFANGEHGMMHKVAPYEATYASPFIVSMPGTIPAGRVSRHSVNAPDVVVTFFSLAGIDLPWDMPGRDFTPLLREPDAVWEHPTLYVHTGPHYGADASAAIRGRIHATHAGVPYYAALRQGELKYVRYFVANEPEELYDLSVDPDELVNKVDDPRYGPQLAALRRSWRDELRRSGADFLDALVEP